MLSLLVMAVIVACVVGLIAILAGKILSSVGIPIAATVGGFLEQYCWVIGVLAGLWYFFSGGELPF